MPAVLTFRNNKLYIGLPCSFSTKMVNSFGKIKKMMTRPITQDSINISYPKTRPYDYIIVQKKHLRYRQYTGKKQVPLCLWPYIHLKSTLQPENCMPSFIHPFLLLADKLNSIGSISTAHVPSLASK